MWVIGAKLSAVNMSVTLGDKNMKMVDYKVMVDLTDAHATSMTVM